ncbi:Kinetochore protein [Yarrowia sp. C11]|nr:Kinetochore protein [Yarrowia sp. E02]KAG5372213.1 Kinetochore protein [Yarrowia sp. C11]
MPPKGSKKPRKQGHAADLASDSLLDQLLAESDDEQELRPVKRRGILASARTKKDLKRGTGTAKRTMSEMAPSNASQEKPRKATRSQTIGHGASDKTNGKGQRKHTQRKGDFTKPIGVLDMEDNDGRRSPQHETEQVITPTEVSSSPLPQQKDLALNMAGGSSAEEELFEVELETAEGFRYKRRLTRRELEELQAEEAAASPEGVEMLEPETENSEMDPDHVTDSTSHSSVHGSHPKDSFMPMSPRDVSLPLKHTPVVQQQDMRKVPAKTPERNHDNRGRRISSLGNGFEGEPHADVDAANFYKHFEPGLPEPHKARLLLTWSGKRAMMNHKTRMVRENAPLGLSETDETTARRIVRVIMEDIIRDMKDGKVNTSWYNRPEFDGDDKSKPRFTKPNAQNIANAEKLALFKKRLAAQQAEIKEWAKLEAEARDRLNMAKDKSQKLVTELQKPFDSPATLPPLLSDVALTASTFPRQIDQVEDAVDKINSCNKRASKFCDEQFDALDNVLEARSRKRPRQSQDFKTIFNADRFRESTLAGEQTRDVLRTLSRLK